jgi:3-hydroxyisobutyrate dehydrogenase-like beta-hydroxyacid dehydrogenase
LALLYLNLQAGEGLLALAKFGVAPEVALRAINGSSGRSLQTQERLPQAVL